ncbi:MAG: hypothetical protein JWO89_2578 [Verrucomicrobiaceae bacterium]|nr:hypothetical protein [Verrucomicrobiaceae bacterium]
MTKDSTGNAEPMKALEAAAFAKKVPWNGYMLGKAQGPWGGGAV